ncbi:MAG: prepilin-type N-terminal cleavage/methylation domain-containing protein [Smithellaceae bacterium]
MIPRRKDHQTKPSGIVSQSGFTLLEILVALTLFGIAISVLVQLYSSSLRTLTTSGQYLPALIIADARMNELLAADNLQEQTKTEYQYDVYRVEISVTEALTERTQSLPVRLMEVDLTVVWQVNQNEKKLQLKSYKTVTKTTQGAKPVEEAQGRS